jgi:hypothetical protein
MKAKFPVTYEIVTPESAKEGEADERGSRTCTGKTGRERTRKHGPWFDGYTDK